MKTINDIVRFCVEIISLFLIIIAGLHIPNNLYKFVVVILVPILIVIFWSKYMAPKSNNRFNNIHRVYSEIILFGFTTIMTFHFVSPAVGTAYGIIAFFNAYLDHKL